MEKAEEHRLKLLLQKFVEDTIPEYVLEGSLPLINNGGIQKISLKQHDDFIDIEGSIQGDDFQIYAPELTLHLKDASFNFNCNCPDIFSGVCRHVSATALKMLRSLESGDEEERTVPRVDWRQTFRSFFATAPEPEPGRHYYIFRFHPEHGRLQVAFYRARQNKAGLSTVHSEVTLEQIIRNPEWSEVSPQLPMIAEQIGRYQDYYGHRLEIPSGLLTWFIWTIKNEYYTLWRDTAQPCTIENKTMRLMLRPNFIDQDLRLEVMLGRTGKKPFPIQGHEVYFFGQLPLWVCWNRVFYPVETSLNAELIQEIVQEPPLVASNEIPEFLDRVWTRLPVSVLHAQNDFLEHMEPLFIKANYSPKLYLGEEGSLLTLQIQNV